MIRSRLFQQYGIDTGKHLNVRGYCHRPFDTLLINSDGACFLCECESWLPASVGNLQIQSIQDIVGSDTAKTLQESILDTSYRYCNNKHCSYLLDDRENSKFPEKAANAKLKYLRLAIDDSCNLSCPSCRIKKIFHKSGSAFKRRMGFAKKILDYIKTCKDPLRIHIGSDGDPFASLVYRYFIRESSKLSNIRYTIQTNGLLLKKMFQKNKNLFKKLDILNVSIDGGTKTTYEKLRRGGKFENIIDNLKFVSTVKKNYNFSLRLHFVVQADNYHEIPKMINLAEEYKVDRLYFNKITDWNTYDNFSSHDITNISHPDHNNYKKLLSEVRKIIRSKHERFVYMPTIGHNDKTF